MYQQFYYLSNLLIATNFLNMTIDIINKYLALVIPLLTFFGYWVKRYYDYKTKKNEIKYSLFYQNKINAIKEFFISYSEFYFAINSNYYLLLKGGQNNFDEIFIPARNKLFAAYANVKIYQNENDLAPYKRIIDRNSEFYNEVFKIIHELSDFTEAKASTHKGNEINWLSTFTEKEDRIDFEIISNQTRVDFIS